MIGQLSYLGEISVLGHLNETEPWKFNRQQERHVNRKSCN